MKLARLTSIWIDYMPFRQLGRSGEHVMFPGAMTAGVDNLYEVLLVQPH